MVEIGISKAEADKCRKTILNNNLTLDQARLMVTRTKKAYFDNEFKKEYGS